MERKKLLTIIAAITVLSLSATGVFALLTNYVSITGLATVDQSVVIDTEDATGGGPLTYSKKTKKQITQ